MAGDSDRPHRSRSSARDPARAEAEPEPARASARARGAAAGTGNAAAKRYAGVGRTGSEHGHPSESSQDAGQRGDASAPRDGEQPGRTIRGPLAPGQMVRSGEAEIEQVSAAMAMIRLGDSSVTIDGQGADGEAYDFYVERDTGTGQRLVRITATPTVRIEEDHDPGAKERLIVHKSAVRSADEIGSAPRMLDWLPGIGDTNPWLTDAATDAEILVMQRGEAVTLTVDGSSVHIEPESENARYAFDLDPAWSDDGLTREVRIVATPGVRVSGESVRKDHGFGRRLVPRVVRVQDPALVPEQGTRIEPGDHVGRRAVLGINHRDPGASLAITDGSAGTLVHEPLTGVKLRIAAKDAAVGARYAYQIVAPRDQRDVLGKTEIRVLVGPGVHIELMEPMARSPLAAGEIDTFGDMNVALVLYETDDIEKIPPQGEPLDPAYLRAVGRERAVDRRAFAPMPRGQALAMAGADAAVSLAPGVGEVYDAMQLGHALSTGTDLQGRDVSRAELVVMAAATFLPFVGAGLVRSAAKGAHAADAARFGLDEPDVLVLAERLSLLSSADRAAIARAGQALRSGQRIDPEDLRHLYEILDERGIVETLPLPALREMHLLDETAGLGHARSSFADQAGDAQRMHPAMESLGTGPERDAMKSTHGRGAGAVEEAGQQLTDRHHVLPREHRAWFEERGFVGEHNIDHYCIELPEIEHKVIHGGASQKLARKHWPEREWTTALMKQLREREVAAGRKLNRDEVLAIARKQMKKKKIADRPFVTYKNRKHTTRQQGPAERRTPEKRQ